MFLYTAYTVLNGLIRFYMILIFVWCIMSWFPIQRGTLIGDVAEVLDKLVRPFMSLFSRFIPAIGGIDFSPLVAIFALTLLQRGLGIILNALLTVL